MKNVDIKSTALTNLNNFLDDLETSDDPKLNKKCMLLSYWLNDYINYINNEMTFEPSRLKSYKRGDIIKVNFGFNVGSEHGGLHYAVVLDKANAHNSPIITVIPLISYSKNKNIHSSSIFLGDDIYIKIYNRIKGFYNSVQKDINKVVDIYNSVISILKTIETGEADEAIINNKLDGFKLEIKKETDKLISIKKSMHEISRMKKGSVALINQITTISKQRIYDPKNTRGVLNGIKLSTENLDKINEKLKELYVF